MKTPKLTMPPLKWDIETLQKVGYVAVGLGGAILVATDPKVRLQLTDDLKRLAEEVQKKLGEATANKAVETEEVTDSSKESSPTTNSSPTSTSCVYLLQVGPFYKIGKSVQFDRRLRQIKLQLPYAVEVVHLISCGNVTHVENYWHRRFHAKRQNGEWFILTEADVQEFKCYEQM